MLMTVMSLASLTHLVMGGGGRGAWPCFLSFIVLFFFRNLGCRQVPSNINQEQIGNVKMIQMHDCYVRPVQFLFFRSCDAIESKATWCKITE